VEEAVGHRQVEAGRGVGQAGEVPGRDRDAVIAPLAADDPLLLRLARALLWNQISLIAVSIASEPELTKNTFASGSGAILTSRSASSITGSVERCEKTCA
jgi:hypothetical protein